MEQQCEAEGAQCPFCKAKLYKLSVCISACKKCEAEYYYVYSDDIGTRIISFNTAKFAIQIYKNSISNVTRVNYLDDRNALFWIKEDLKIKNSSLEKIELKIDKYLMLS